MEKRYAIIIENVVTNVVIWDDENGPFPTIDGQLAVENGWASPGDWYEQTEPRFYRGLPNDGEQG